MYINIKMIPVETVPGILGGGMKESSGGVNSSRIYCENLCKCYNVHPLSTTTIPIIVIIIIMIIIIIIIIIIKRNIGTKVLLPKEEKRKNTWRYFL
jgi:hypothetical protein